MKIHYEGEGNKIIALEMLKEVFDNFFINTPLDYVRYHGLVSLIKMPKAQFNHKCAPGNKSGRPKLTSILWYLRTSQDTFDDNALTLFTKDTRGDSIFATLTEDESKKKFIILDQPRDLNANWTALVKKVRADLPDIKLVPSSTDPPGMVKVVIKAAEDPPSYRESVRDWAPNTLVQIQTVFGAICATKLHRMLVDAGYRTTTTPATTTPNSISFNQTPILG